MLEGEFHSYFVAHEVPREVVDGGPGPDGHGGFDGNEPPIPFSDLVEPIDRGAAHAKEKADGNPADPPAPDPEKDEAPAEDGANKRSGGPRLLGEDGQDGGAPAAAPPADAPPTDGTAAAATPPKKEFEYLKQSTAPAKIFVVGTSSFVTDDSLSMEPNVLFLQNVIDYMAAESLSTLRAKRIDDGQFDEPSATEQFMAKALGWFAAPILLLGIGIFVYVWRRTIRPARVRRRMAAALAAAK